MEGEGSGAGVEVSVEAEEEKVVAGTLDRKLPRHNSLVQHVLSLCQAWGLLFVVVVEAAPSDQEDVMVHFVQAL